MGLKIRQSDADVSAALQRVMNELIDRARSALERRSTDPIHATHAARVACKQLRAVLRLVRDDMKRAKACDQSVRNAARQLSSSRDQFVLLECARHLQMTSGDREQEPMRHLVAWCAHCHARAELAADPLNDPATDAARTHLALAAKACARWSPTENTLDAMRKGFRETYRNARRRGRAALGSETPVLYHDSRKDVKYHWYQVRFLCGLKSAWFRDRAPTRASSRLEQ